MTALRFLRMMRGDIAGRGQEGAKRVQRRQIVSAIAIAATVAFAPLTTEAQSVVPVSSPTSPFSGCTAGQEGADPNFENSKVETRVAVNPVNPGNIIGVYQQDRWYREGARAILAAYSMDGGSNWGMSALPFGTCAGGLPFDRVSDPWVSIGPDGVAYATALGISTTSNVTAILAATSTDGGKTWGDETVVKQDLAPNHQFLNDKDSVTSDPVHAGVAYAVWERTLSPSPQDKSGRDAAPDILFGVAWFSKTKDGGKTWAPLRPIIELGRNVRTRGHVIVVDSRTDTLYDFYLLLDLGTTPATRSLAFSRSDDMGDRWQGPFHVVDGITVVPVIDTRNVNPESGNPPTGLRTPSIFPQPAIDPATGQLYVAWQTRKFGGPAAIGITSSIDGGVSWSEPKRVDTPTPGAQAFNQSVAVASDHRVGIAYYQLERTSVGSEPTSYWIKSFAPAAVTSPDQHAIDTAVTAQHVRGPFNMLAAPWGPGYFVGDYGALAAAGESFVAFFAATNCLDLSCSALEPSLVLGTAGSNPPLQATGNNSTDIYAAVGF